MLARVIGGDGQEVLQAALGVVGQRVDARDVLLGADDPHRRAALGQRPGAADGGDDHPPLGRDERGRQQPVGGQADVELDAAVDLHARAREVLERLAPDVEHGVGADERVAQRGGLLGVERLGLLAVLGRAEVEVARDAQQLARGDRRAGAAAAVGDVGLDRAEVAAAVEDDRQRVAQREALDAQRDGSRRLGVDERPAEQIVGVVVAHGVLLDGLSTSSPTFSTIAAAMSTHRSMGVGSAAWELIYKPFGIILGLLAGLVGKKVFDFVWTKIDDEEPPEGDDARRRPGPRLLAAAAVQGVIFTRDPRRRRPLRRDRLPLPHGIWPGEKRPDPDE